MKESKWFIISSVRESKVGGYVVDRGYFVGGVSESLKEMLVGCVDFKGEGYCYVRDFMLFLRILGKQGYGVYVRSPIRLYKGGKMRLYKGSGLKWLEVLGERLGCRIEVVGKGVTGDRSLPVRKGVKAVGGKR